MKSVSYIKPFLADFYLGKPGGALLSATPLEMDTETRGLNNLGLSWAKLKLILIGTEYLDLRPVCIFKFVSCGQVANTISL